MAQLSKFEKWWLDAWPHRFHIRRYVPKFLHACPEPFRGQVLEIGSGSGWTASSIMESYPQVELTATDIDQDLARRFERLQSRYGQRLKVRAADALDLPFDRATFDMVVAFHVLHHIADVPRAVQQCVRVLRPGGWLGIADENQRYVVGPLRRLWPADSRIDKEDVQQLIAREANVMTSAGDVHYYIWAQKSYPN